MNDLDPHVRRAAALGGGAAVAAVALAADLLGPASGSLEFLHVGAVLIASRSPHPRDSRAAALACSVLLLLGAIVDPAAASWLARSAALLLVWAASLLGARAAERSAAAPQPILEWRGRTLEAIAVGAELPDVLRGIVETAETLGRGVVYGALVVDESGRGLRPAAAPSLPPALIEAIGQVEVGAETCPCSVAITRGERVVVSGLHERPEWTEFGDAMRSAGFSACWSEPVRSPNGDVLGALTGFAVEPREPNEDELELLRTSAHFAGIAIEHRRSQQALRDSEARVRAIVDHAVDAIITIDERGSIESFNPAAERIFGWTEQEVVGRNVRLLMPSPDAERHDGYLRRYLETGERRIIGIGREVVGLRKDGTPLPIDLGVSELRAGSARKFTAILRDLTDRKQLEEEFLHAQKMEAIGRLAGGIAHDFNNLLAGIVGCCRVAKDQLEEGHPAAEQLGEIADAAERGAGVTRQLLAFSRPKKVCPEPVQLNRIVTQSEAMLRGFLGEDVELGIVLAPSGGPVVADPAQIEQILMNLLVNARDAMPEGGRIGIQVADVELEGLGDGAPEPFVLLTVEDTGEGMEEDVQARAFEPFYTTKAEGEGTGLGLATVYGMVQQLGGHVALDSEIGKGTAVRIHLPLDEGEAEPGREAGESEESRGDRPGPATVLLVEDDRLVRAGIRHQLRGMGYEVLVADGPDAAIRVCEERAGPIDLLLTDIVMPGTNGYELSREILRREPTTRVLYMSALPNDVLVQQGRLAPGLPSIEKPFSDEELAAAVGRVLEADGSAP